MKRLALVLLVACESKPVVAPVADAPAVPSASAPAPAPASASASASAPTSVPGSPARKKAKAGEMCGGIAGIGCADGLVCKMTGPMHPDKSGTCVAGD